MSPKKSFNFNTKFGKEAWNPSDWLLVHSPRWPNMSHWEQNADCISNYVPDDIKPEDMQMGRDRTAETYVSMLLKHPIMNDATIETSCSFEGRMAPLIVLSQELASIHHDHIEVVMYDRGINIWHHYFRENKPSWKLLSFIDMPLKIGEKHTMSVSVRFNQKGAFLFVKSHGQLLGSRIDTNWPNKYYVGITGCEGKNSFYDFSVKEEKESNPALLERFTD